MLQRFLKFLLLVLCSLYLVSLCISMLLYFSDLNVHTLLQEVLP